jgi:glutathione synthase/RimK-type ligase-like ATP-grasp enzyme
MRHDFLRTYGISLDHPYYQKHIAFFEILDIWKGMLLGQKRDHYQNFSKGYQGITSIRTSSLLNKKKVRYPKSFFVKGDYWLLRDKFKESLIVKSCSNMRSKVVSDEVFSEWDLNKLNNLPTLFQEKISGMDIRVHVCGNVVWPLQVETKDCIDYRYASKGSVSYNEIQLPSFIKNFCRSIAQVEKNKFIGVDLMKSNNKYYCFESNPGPGWSTYHHSSKKIFAKNVFKQLLKE